MISKGLSLFGQAVESVMRQPGPALRIAAVPVLIAAAVFALDEYFWAVASDTGQDYAGLYYVSLVFDVVMVGFVAVAWHRFVLMDEAPNGVFPHITPRMALGYAVYWFIVGFVIMLMLLVVYFAVLYAGRAMGVFDPVLGQIFMSASYSPDAGGVWTTWIGGTVFVYFLFRMGLGLPDMALGINRLDMLASLRQTRPLRGPIFVVALVAGAAQTPLLSYLTYVEDRMMNGAPMEVAAHGVVSGIFWGIVALFGASILTVIYRETGGSEVPQDQESGGGPFKGEEDEGLF